MLSKNSHSLALASVIATTASVAFALGGSPKVDENEVSARIQPVARVALAAAAPKGGATSRSGEELYKAVCTACHDTGVAGAPKTGDKAAWAPRIALGLDGLLKSAIAGKNAMPPKGGAADASEEEMKRVVSYIANKSGATFQ